MKQNNIAIFQASSYMSAGSAQSTLQLIIDLKNLGLNPYVFLNKKGNVEKFLKDNGIEYYIINNCSSDGYWTVDVSQRHVNILRFILKSFINHVKVNKTVKICKKLKISLIYVSAITTCQGILVAKKMRIPYIWHIREFMEEDLGIRFANKNKAIRLMNNSNSLIAVSKAVKDKFSSYIDESKIKVIYNGVNRDKYYKERNIFSKEKIIISVTGRINPKKGQHELLEAISLLNKDILKNVQVNIIGQIGDTGYEKRLNQIIEENDIKKYIKYVSFTTNIEHYLWKTDILCVPSVKEAFGRTTVEGMQAGCLVIGSASGGTKELISNGETGYLYETGNPKDLANKIEMAIKNVELSKKIAKNGQIIALEKFSDKKNAKEILNVINDNME